ncbi:MAG: hypothetical protein HN995_12130 [Candidatus Marinimicrobia bacterium]|jgi:hypothetical protein|nr:hypothetical protein [Candidatus Neomarinimicrobiota bacterium]MBT3576552.1 hypothetical protein [Candidatus Neomarinimicrobiota bacterium]MBT3680112.1 hypothetical protein [Candidatus Neomarinimicrobiota bacterium]MBT3951319.1 hypothetical protein [Candidatus Neomarinimicrobiota bacterium]MBT4253064.1 hypothetical protein [Candidatus Neomarinimicrobiota bacterium]
MLHKLVPGIFVVLGISLMIYMIIFEDEPGGIPILMILFGAGWYLVSRIRSKSNNK